MQECTISVNAEMHDAAFFGVGHDRKAHTVAWGSRVVIFLLLLIIAILLFGAGVFLRLGAGVLKAALALALASLAFGAFQSLPAAMWWALGVAGIVGLIAGGVWLASEDAKSEEIRRLNRERDAALVSSYVQRSPSFQRRRRSRDR